MKAVAKGSAKRLVWVSMTGDCEPGWAERRRRGTGRMGESGCLERGSCTPLTGWLGRREGLQIAWVLWEPPLGDWPLDGHFLKEACI